MPRTYQGTVTASDFEALQFRYRFRAGIVLALLSLSALGPYLLMQFGLRTDHVVIYPLAVFAAFKHIGSGRLLPRPGTLAIIALILIVPTLWILTVTFAGGNEHISTNQIIAELENEIQPVALVFILSWYLGRLSLGSLEIMLAFASVLLCVLLSLHAILEIISLQYDIWPFISPFVRHQPSEEPFETVWGAARDMGRHCGLFQQPVEAGVAYCTGLIAWMYWSTTAGKRSLWLNVCLPLIIIGGVLPVSKVFLLGAPILSIVFLALSMHRKHLLIGTFVAATVLVYVSAIPQFAEWSGAEGITWVFSGEEMGDVFRRYTAGRLGDDGGWTMNAAYGVLQDSPLFGYGYASDAVGPYDGAHLERLVVGGIPALLLYLALLGVIGTSAVRRMRTSRIHSTVLFSLFLLVVGAGLGAPVISLNRCSIWLWILIVLSIAVIDYPQPQSRLVQFEGIGNHWDPVGQQTPSLR